MKTIRTTATKTLLVVLLLTMVGCATHTHVVGNGGTDRTLVEKRQWYILWGLVPVNEVDSKQMANSAQNYTVVTESSLIDSVINILLGVATVHTRTVTVIR